jgi:hypothetical protein
MRENVLKIMAILGPEIQSAHDLISRRRCSPKGPLHIHFFSTLARSRTEPH